MVHLQRQRGLRIVGLLMGVCANLLVGPASAQQRPPVLVSPHQLRFDPHTKVATLEFHNVSDSTKQAIIIIEFSYLNWPHGLPTDTMLFAPRAGLFDPHDTVIATPRPKDHFAGRWLSGVPTQVTLAPHETKRVTVRFSPPPNLPAGEYWARIVAMVRPPDPHHGAGQDVQQRYVLPTKGNAILLRDTCAVRYRQGPLHMGLKIGPGAVARIDSANDGVIGDPFSHALWIRIPLVVTGNVPYRGIIHFQWIGSGSLYSSDPNSFEILLMKDVVLHMVAETDKLLPGHYNIVITFDGEQADDLLDRSLPVPPQITLPFDIKPAWAY